MPIRLLSLSLALLLVPTTVLAQRSVRLCMPDGSTAQRQLFAVELRARGYAVEESCEDASQDVWLLRLEVPDALADVWIVATRVGHETRRARVAGPLDTIDPHVLALSGASLLEEEEPTPGAVAPQVDVDLEEEEPTPEAVAPEVDVPIPPEPVVAVEAESSSEPSAAEDDAPPELVRSTRNIGAIVVLELGAAAGLVTTEQGTVGGVGGVGLSLSPWFRVRFPFSFQFWPDRVWEFGTGMAFDFLLSLVTSQTWLELGLAGRTQLRFFADPRMRVLLGGDVHVAFYQAISDSVRFFTRAEAMALGDINQASDPAFGLYLSAGFAVVL